MLPGLHKSRHGHDVSLDQYRYIIHVDVQSAGAAIVFSLSWTYSLTQPLQTTGKVGGKVNKLLCTYTVIGTQKKSCTVCNPSQTLFYREEHNFIDKTILQKLFNLVLLMHLLSTVCVLHEPITVQSRQGMEEAIF